MRRHPWIFSGAVATVRGDPAPGDTVAVESSAGDFLAWAAFSPTSQIRGRVWSFDRADVIDDRLRRRHESSRAHVAGIHCSLRHRLGARSCSARPTAFRVSSPIATATSWSARSRRPAPSGGATACADALAALPGVTSVFERSDARRPRARGARSHESVRCAGRSRRRSSSPHEGRWRFAVDVRCGPQDRLLPRPARVAASRAERRRRAGGCSTCSPTPARSASSPPAAERRASRASTRRDRRSRSHGATHELNDVDVGELIEADAFTALRTLRDRARQYDLILLDPPKLALSDRHLDKASRAYKDLNLLAIKLLAPGGVLMTFSCSAAMIDRAVPQGARRRRARRRPHRARRRRARTRPSDHPVPLSFPEAEYLKGFVLEAE